MATRQVIVPPPPRLSGDWQTDYVAISFWMSQFYTANTTPPGTFDPSALPEPTNTTSSLAQQTANIAYKFADLINKSLPTPVTPPTS